MKRQSRVESGLLGKDSPAMTAHLLAALAWSLAAVANGIAAAPLFLIGIVFIVGAAPLGSLRGKLSVSVGVLVVGGLGWTTDLFRIPAVTPSEMMLWLGPPLLLAVAALAARDAVQRAKVVAAVVLWVALFAAGVGVMSDHAQSEVGIDVYLAHLSAATALEEGENPYTDAVRYPDGSPFAEPGTIVEGYGYPPVALWSYAIATWLTGDPRWLNVVVWAAVVGGVLVRVYRHHNQWVLPVALVLAVAPAWRLMVFTGWTEPLTLGLLLSAAFVWRRSWLWSGVLLGLALASKQYMVLLAPLLLLHRDEDQVSRLGTAGATVMLTFLPFVTDLRALIDSLITRPLSFGYRSDTQSLPRLLDEIGIGPEVPTLAALAVVVLVSWAMTRVVRGPDTFLVAASVVLASFFFLTLGFANYWFLVAGMLVVGAAFLPADVSAGQRHH
jgi:hypothetical protein